MRGHQQCQPAVLQVTRQGASLSPQHPVAHFCPSARQTCPRSGLLHVHAFHLHWPSQGDGGEGPTTISPVTLGL